MTIPIAIRPTPRALFLAAGFTTDGDSLRRGPLILNFEDQWLAFEVAAGAVTHHLPQLSLGQAGLWKMKTPSSHAFELPASILAAADVDPDDDDSPDAQTAGQLVDWAVATLDGSAPEGWRAPDEALVRSWLPVEALTIQCGPLVRRIDLVHQPSRLALRTVLVPGVTGPLSAARCVWTERTLAAAQNQWRMVRLGFGGKVGKTTIEAECDLSGCPGAVCQELLLSALAALEQVSRQLLPTFTVLTDSNVHCDTWESSF